MLIFVMKDVNLDITHIVLCYVPDAHDKIKLTHKVEI